MHTLQLTYFNIYILSIRLIYSCHTILFQNLLCSSFLLYDCVTVRVTYVTIIHDIILYLLSMFKIKNKEKKNKVKFIAHNSDTNSIAKWHTLLSSSGFSLLKFLSSDLRYVTYVTSRGAVHKLKPKVAPICLPHSQMMHKYLF